MADTKTSQAGETGVRGSSIGGLAAEHPADSPVVLPVGTSTASEFNQIRLRLIPIACWQVEDIRFAFDSSFVLGDSGVQQGDDPSDVRAELGHLAELVADHPGCPLSVFGHADPVGSDVYNKALSGRRATAVYALLIANTDLGSATKLWQQIAAAENWGQSQHDAMQSFLGQSSLTGSALLQAYLQQLAAPGPKLSKTDFLAQGADSGGKGDYQGCSEFNPLILFSQEEQQAFTQAAQSQDASGLAARNQLNAPNRRVMVLMFRQNSRIDPAKWPCPRASEGIAGCQKRFWSDGESRRGTLLSGSERKFQETKDTFACRFYQRLSNDSPCQGMVGLVHISNILFLNYPASPLQNKDYKLYIDDVVIQGNTGQDGLVQRERVAPGDYRLEVANRVTYVSAIPLSMSRVPWLLDVDAANGAAPTDQGIPQ